MKIVLAVLLVTLALAEAGSSSTFADYKVSSNIFPRELNSKIYCVFDIKAKHGKSYNAAEHAVRSKIWTAAKSKIDAHNALYAKGQVSYTLEDNHLTDLVNTIIKVPLVLS